MQKNQATHTNIFFSVLLLAIFFAFAGCKSSKRNKPQSWLSKAYHNTTARYNGYYHSKLLVNESQKELDDKYIDNYTKLLVQYPFAASTDAAAVESNLNSAIEKSSVVIALHRDKSKWIDDNYLLIGRAQYLSKDYGDALKTFDYIIREYNPDKEKKKKKRKKRKKRKKKNKEKKERLSFIYHQSVYRDARLLKTQTLLELGRLEQVDVELSQLDLIQTKDKKYFKRLDLLKSYVALKKGEYASAESTLRKLVGQKGLKKKEKARLYYILGQLYQEQHDYVRSDSMYRKTIKSHPKYEMVFNAKLNLLKNGINSNNLEDDALTTLVGKMIKDLKNEEYLDQLYYQLALVEYEDGDKDSAISNLLMSLDYSTTNNVQKAESYLMVANIKYESKEYYQSKLYLDSTIILISESDSRKPDIQARINNLEGIAQKESSIALNDSLIKIYSYNDEEKRALAKRLIAQDKSEDTKKVVGPTSVLNSSFWAYNEKAYKKGDKDFKKIWGNRPLVDNWRVLSEETIDLLEDSNVLTRSEGSELTTKELTAVFADVPKGQSGVSLLEKENEESLYALSKLYHAKVNDTESSISAIKKLLFRYPDTKYKAELYYTLVQRYAAMDDSFNVALYKQKLLEEAPSSRYTMLANNPELITQLQKGEAEVRATYKEALELYNLGKISTASTLVRTIDKSSQSSDFASKVALLEALLIGSTGDRGSYIKGLKEVVTVYPATSAGIEAKTYLEILTGEGVDDKVTYESALPKDIGETEFKFEMEEKHYVVIIVTAPSMNIFELRKAASNYIGKNYKADKLSVSSATLDKGVNAIVIRQYDNAKKALMMRKELDKEEPHIKLFGQQLPYNLYVMGRTDFSEVLKNGRFNIFVKEHEAIHGK